MGCWNFDALGLGTMDQRDMSSRSEYYGVQSSSNGHITRLNSKVLIVEIIHIGGRTYEQWVLLESVSSNPSSKK